MKGSGDGDAFATERLGYLYSEGIGSDGPDAEKSFECFINAAMDGVSTAMHMAGYYYLNGIGVEKNTDEAVKWLKMAADNGIEEAQELLSEIRQ